MEFLINTPTHPVPTDVLGALREATGARHALLDDGLAIAGPGATLADYEQHLRMLHAWLLPLEAWLATFHDGPSTEPTLPPLPRAATIAGDLEHAAMPAVSQVRLETPPWPPDASAAYRWGVCYVIEGSQLGGAVLYQRLKERLAPHPLRYFAGEGSGPGPRWRAFMLALRAHVRSADEVDDVCHGACDAFDRLLALRDQLHAMTPNS